MHNYENKSEREKRKRERKERTVKSYELMRERKCERLSDHT